MGAWLQEDKAISLLPSLLVLGLGVFCLFVLFSTWHLLGVRFLGWAMSQIYSSGNRKRPRDFKRDGVDCRDEQGERATFSEAMNHKLNSAMSRRSAF